MDPPLGLTMVNFFLADLETRLLQQTLNCFPKLYYKYVENIFAVFDTECACVEFLNLLNSQNKNMKFTKENSFATFLDFQLKVKDGNFDSWIRRNSTNIGVILTSRQPVQ